MLSLAAGRGAASRPDLPPIWVAQTALIGGRSDRCVLAGCWWGSGCGRGCSRWRWRWRENFGLQNHIGESLEVPGAADIYLDISGSSAANNPPAIVWGGDGAKSQEWNIATGP
jgi:hypothetical protein